MKPTHTTTRSLFLLTILAVLTSFPPLRAAPRAGSYATVAPAAAHIAALRAEYAPATASLGLQTSAFASAAASGTRRTVCAASLKVRGATPPGYYIGELDRGETFLLVRQGDVWAYGFAYGKVNKWGYVMKKYLC